MAQVYIEILFFVVYSKPFAEYSRLGVTKLLLSIMCI